FLGGVVCHTRSSKYTSRCVRETARICGIQRGRKRLLRPAVTSFRRIPVRVEDLILMEHAAVTGKSKERKRSMVWVIFAVGAVLSWGIYGPALHKGQTQLGSPLKALLCVGIAYFLIGVLVPVLGLSSQGGVSGFNTGGSIWAGIGGALGAL